MMPFLDGRIGCFFIFDDCHDIAHAGDIAQTKDLDGSGRRRFFYAFAGVIEHGFDTAPIFPDDNHIADFQGAGAHQYSEKGTARAVHFGFDDSAFCRFVRVGFKVLQFGHDHQVFQQI